MKTSRAKQNGIVLSKVQASIGGKEVYSRDSFPFGDLLPKLLLVFHGQILVCTRDVCQSKEETNFEVERLILPLRAVRIILNTADVVVLCRKYLFLSAAAAAAAAPPPPTTTTIINTVTS